MTSPTTLRRPCIVVGAGPVGLAAALALRARGLPATVLEANGPDRPRTGSRAIYIHLETLQALEACVPGLGRRLSALGLVWPTRRTYWRGHQVYERTYPLTLRDGLPPFTSVSQLTTEDVLRKACDEAGVEFGWDTEISAVRSDSDGVSLTTTTGDTWTAPYVIAADGSRSTLRRGLGITMNGSRSERSFIIIDVAEVESDPLPLARIFHYQHPDTGGRNVLLAPFTGFWRADLQCRPDDDPEEFSDGPGAAAWISAVLGPRYADRIVWSSAYKFLQVVADRFADEQRRVLLAGEAAHLFAPFGARGMNSGVADSVSAADAIAAALADPSRRREAVDRFAEDRREAALYNRASAGSALKYLTSPTPSIRIQQFAAKTIARWGIRAGRSLDAAPYGSTSGRRGAAGRY